MTVQMRHICRKISGRKRCFFYCPPNHRKYTLQMRACSSQSNTRKYWRFPTRVEERAAIFSSHIIFSKSVFEFATGNVDWRLSRVLRGKINNAACTQPQTWRAKLSLVQEWKCYLLPRDIYILYMCAREAQSDVCSPNSQFIPSRKTRPLCVIVHAFLVPSLFATLFVRYL